MAIAAAAEAGFAGPNLKVFDVTALDADTGPTAFNHTMAANPLVIPWPQISPANYPSWGFTTGATQITASKLNAVGSGGAVPGTTVVMKLIVLTPHSIMQ